MRLCLVLLCYCCVFAATAQSLRAYERAAQQAYVQGDYYTAKQRYETVLKSKSNDPQLYFRYAEACRNTYAYAQAVTAYEKVLALDKAATYRDFYYHYGQSLKHLARYDEARAAFQHYLKGEASNSFLFEKAKQEVAACLLAPSLLATPASIEIQHLGDSINSPYSEFAAHRVGEELYFSSLRFERKKRSIREQLQQPTAYISKIVRYSAEAKKQRPLAYINPSDRHTANSSYCSHTKELYFTYCDPKAGDTLQCALYRSTWDGSRWTKAVSLPEPMNLPNCSTTQPFVYWDSLAQKQHLWFVSNRAGGIGRMDIWHSSRALSEAFANPTVLPSPVNSRGEEATPFWSAEEQRLYFSSKWHAGLGGYDVFYTEKEQEGWSAPVNMGPPVNSAANDLYFLRYDSLGYLSSNRKGSQTLMEEACCNDLYELKWPTPIEADTPALVQIDSPELEVPPIEPSPLETLQEMLPISLYFHNDEPDSNSLDTSTSIPYHLAYQSYITRVPQYAQAHSDDSEAQAAINRFLEEQVGGEYRRLHSFLNGVLTILEAGERIELQLRGFTSPKAVDDYNDALARRRIESVEKELLVYKEGAFLPYLRKGQIQLKRLPFGEQKVPEGVSDSQRNLRLSVYSKAAAQERRVEIEAILAIPQ